MLQASRITKKFAGVSALNEVSLHLAAGKVTAIIGENGAGKSTLMKILSGVYSDYEGDLVYKGEVIRFKNTRDAQQVGIAIIHQELNLIPYLSITENLFLGRELKNSLGMLDKKAMKIRAVELLKKLKLVVSPDTHISDLKVGQQQVVEIAKALLYDAEVIIMDEPTSAISENEVEVLHGIINELRAENKAIVYISHKLKELFKIADCYTVLRDGKTIESGEMASMTYDSLIHKMVGRELDKNLNQRSLSTAPVLLKVNDLCLNKILKNISFELKAGEVLGVFGLMGAGRTELMESLMGEHKSMQGAVVLENQEVNFKSPGDAIRGGIVLVPEDRKKHGLVLGLDVKTNISLSCLKLIKNNAGFLKEKSEIALAKKYITSLKIKTPSENQLVKNLSGGNQQKIVIAKCMATAPKVLMLDEPTRGIDINAKTEIYKLISELAAAGLGIIMVSSELPEILAISDRVLVMSEGRVTAEFETIHATEDQILKAAIADSI
ncbi:sugar ABC transporter ATP-binding protein [Pedobacter alpinus]|uniref:Sugar ABC transporter ATP-binding protein n=1 Tax=Pedobacter alpinus TaxID=1590643 RepID=A0ABW5TQ01_9SPHI